MRIKADAGGEARDVCFERGFTLHAVVGAREFAEFARVDGTLPHALGGVARGRQYARRQRCQRVDDRRRKLPVFGHRDAEFFESNAEHGTRGGIGL